MSTADTAEKQAGHAAAWANLIVCGGISWAVSLWHATHATTSGNKFLAVLAATAPVVTAAFASHHVAKKGVKLGKRIMTCIVFLMGMALSVKAQAQSIGPIVGGVELGVVFALMLDVSTFLALSSIMSKPVDERSPADKRSTGAPAKASTGVSTDASVSASTTVSKDASVGASNERPRTPVVDTPMDAQVSVQRTPPAERPRTPKKTTKPAAKKPSTDTRAEARKILKESPDMNAADLARALGLKPAGSIRTMRTKLLEELTESGEIPRMRAVGS